MFGVTSFELSSLHLYKIKIRKFSDFGETAANPACLLHVHKRCCLFVHAETPNYLMYQLHDCGE